MRQEIEMKSEEVGNMRLEAESERESSGCGEWEGVR